MSNTLPTTSKPSAYGLYMEKCSAGEVNISDGSLIVNCYIKKLNLTSPNNTVKNCSIENLQGKGIFALNNIGSITTSSNVSNCNFTGVGTLFIAQNYYSLSTIDASQNYWGSSLTQEMNSLGDNNNISGIHDFMNDISLPRVIYTNWRSSPVIEAGPDW